MKVLIDFINKENIRKDVDYLIGLNNFSYNVLQKYNLNEVLEIINLLHSKNVICGVNLEKIMFDQDLNNLKDVLVELEKEKVDFITYSDLGVYQIIKELNLNINTIYHASTLITNYYDIELMLLENYNVILGKEISYEELKLINNKLPRKAYIDAFGKFPIFYSRRNLISTYFEFRGINDNPKDLDYTLIEEFRNEEYPITEEDSFTVYDTAFYCLGDELKELQNIGSVYLASNFLNLEDYNKIIDIYLQEENIDQEVSKIVDIYKGKLSEKTILIKGGNN